MVVSRKEGQAERTLPQVQGPQPLGLRIQPRPAKLQSLGSCPLPAAPLLVLGRSYGQRDPGPTPSDHTCIRQSLLSALVSQGQKLGAAWCCTS